MKFLEMLGIKRNARRVGKFVGRMRTGDYGATALTYRMQAGFPGDVNRTHPASIEPCLIDASAPPTAYGQPVLVDATTQGVRPFASGDQSASAVAFYGFTVRPFPLQQNSATPQFNTGTPPLTGVVDVVRFGYVMVLLGNGALTGAVKDGAVYVWTAASTGNHVLGGIETTYTAGSSTLLTGAHFNGVQDANGIVEVSVAVQGS